MIAALSVLSGVIAFAGERSAAQTRPLLVERMGTVMTLAAARHAISFTPFVPPRSVLAVALIPPYAGADTRRNRGIAVEYTDGRGHAYVFATWPANGASISRFAHVDDRAAGCAQSARFGRAEDPPGYVWRTPRGIIATLQPDGASDAPTLQREWLQLVKRGACR